MGTYVQSWTSLNPTGIREGRRCQVPPNSLIVVIINATRLSSLYCKRMIIHFTPPASEGKNTMPTVVPSPGRISVPMAAPIAVRTHFLEQSRK